jgi:hypothetical protein
MKLMILMKATADSEAGVMPSEELLAAMGKYNEELVNAGILLGGEGLHPSAKGVRVRFGAGAPTVVEGPFPNTQELVSGFWIWNVKSMEDAIAWVKRCPAVPGGETVIEIRKVAEAEDFGEAFTPELREQEEKLRARVEEASRTRA